MKAPTELQPVFVFSSYGAIALFKSVELAAGGIESVDVRDGEYVEVFGIDGERFEITADGHTVTLRNTGVLELARLRERLRTLAERNGYSGEDPDRRFVANEVFANEWRMRWPRWPKWLDRRLHGEGPAKV